jgi:hypothetical protein
MATPDRLEVAESVPQVPAQERLQVTPPFCISFVTVAVNGCVPAWTLAVVGEALTDTAAVTDSVVESVMLPEVA